LIELINMSALYISNPTGPLHLAGALNKKTISFFPKTVPTNLERWKPLGGNNFIFEEEKDNPNSKFIEGIEAEDVIRKSIEMLKT
jgi:ADP-heptose:LPS heptosyltransferase